MPSCVSYALFQTVTVTVNISVADYHDKINERPDSASAHSQKHRYAGLGMPGIETVNAETSKEEAQKQRHQPLLIISRNSSVLYRSIVNCFAAAWTE